MKIVYFVVNGKPTLQDRAKVEKYRSDQNKVIYSNGSVPYGFEDSCDAVFLSGNFPLIEKWALSKGIQVLKPEPVKEVTPDAETHTSGTQEEAQADEEVKPKQRRTRRVKQEDNPSE